MAARGRCTFRKNDVKRAITSAAKAGIKVGTVEVTPEGVIRVIAAGDAPTKKDRGGWDRPNSRS